MKKTLFLLVLLFSSGLSFAQNQDEILSLLDGYRFSYHNDLGSTKLDYYIFAFQKEPGGDGLTGLFYDTHFNSQTSVETKKTYLVKANVNQDNELVFKFFDYYSKEDAGLPVHLILDINKNLHLLINCQLYKLEKKIIEKEK